MQQNIGINYKRESLISTIIDTLRTFSTWARETKSYIMAMKGHQESSAAALSLSGWLSLLFLWEWWWRGRAGFKKLFIGLWPDEDEVNHWKWFVSLDSLFSAGAETWGGYCGNNDDIVAGGHRKNWEPEEKASDEGNETVLVLLLLLSDEFSVWGANPWWAVAAPNWDKDRFEASQW